MHSKTFKIGDYVKHKAYPKSKVILYVRSELEKQVVNAQAYNFELATEDDIKQMDMEGEIIK